MAIKNRADFVCPPQVPPTIKAGNPAWLRFDFLEFCVKQNGWKAGAELGLWEGRTIHHLLSTCPGLTMIGVDLWQAQPDNVGPEGYEGWDHAHHEAVCRDRCRPFGKRARIINGWTTDAADQVEDASLDFVFIDADHSEEGCRRDIDSWLPKVKPTGWIMGHDINWPGVRVAVDDLMPGYEVGPDVVWFRPVNLDHDWPIWK